MFNLEKDWVAIAAPGPWQEADDASVRGGEACVVEHDASRLHHFDGSAWHSSPSPISGPRSVWGTDEALWIAGDGGAARFENGAFEKVEGVNHVTQVLGRNAHDVWLCTADGVFRTL